MARRPAPTFRRWAAGRRGLGIRGLGALLLLAGCNRALAAQVEVPAKGRLRLTRDSVVAGVTCGPTGRHVAVLHTNGRLDECPTARDTVIADHALPAGTWLQFTEAGVLFGAWLPDDAMLQGLPCKGRGYRQWSVRFHPNGRLALCFPARDVVVQGVPCLGAGFWREVTGGPTAVSFDADGRFRRCRLSRAHTVDGVSHPKGARFERR